MPSARVRLPLLILSLTAGVALTSATACKEPTAGEAQPAEAKSETRTKTVKLHVEPTAKPVNAEAPTLASVLDAKTQAADAKRPAEKTAMMQAALDQLAASDILAKAIKVGDQAPDFTLPNAAGEQVNLKALLERGPVVVLWYRGSWCPYCNIALKGYADAAKQITAAGGTLVAISPEQPDDSLDKLDEDQKAEFDYPILSDAGNAVANEYGIVYQLPPDLAVMYNQAFDLNRRNGDESNKLPLAATYVIGQDGTITWAFLDVDYKKRAEPSDVVAAVLELAPSKTPTDAG